ncbi:MAG: hypothetical protein AABZ06_10280 [Bdellovibrionota bacterium]
MGTSNCNGQEDMGPFLVGVKQAIIEGRHQILDTSFIKKADPTGDFKACKEYFSLPPSTTPPEENQDYYNISSYLDDRSKRTNSNRNTSTNNDLDVALNKELTTLQTKQQTNPGFLCCKKGYLLGMQYLIEHLTKNPSLLDKEAKACKKFYDAGNEARKKKCVSKDENTICTIINFKNEHKKYIGCYTEGYISEFSKNCNLPDCEDACIQYSSPKLNDKQNSKSIPSKENITQDPMDSKSGTLHKAEDSIINNAAKKIHNVP